MTIDVRLIDPADDAGLKDYHETLLAGEAEGRIDPAQRSLPELALVLRTPTTTTHNEIYLAFLGGTPVGAGVNHLPLLDNLEELEFDFVVRPEFRRQGVGAAMFDFMVSRAKGSRRPKLYCMFSSTAGTEDTAPAVSFLAKRGLTRLHTELRQQAPLPIPDEALVEMEAKAAPYLDGYRILTWTNPCPEEWAAQYANLKGLLSTEAPTGDLEIEPEVWDVDRLRENEKRSALVDRSVYTAVAVAPDGTLAGHTQATATPGRSGRAQQLDTLVLTAHRGHRLGLALKAANMRQLQKVHPDMNRIDTYNAGVNGPMLAINTLLGFKPIEVSQEWQGRVDV